MGARYVRAHGLRFAALQWGPDEGPLALLLHGFPDSPSTWQQVGPALAEAGYRVVAPWLRGFAPTEVPDPPVADLVTLTADANALHRALGGDRRAILVGHDWGAATTYRAAEAAPDRWRRVVALALPPERAFADILRDRHQLRRFAYIGAMRLPGAARALAADDLAVVDRLWRRWSPGWQPPPEVVAAAKAALRDAGSRRVVVSLYRSVIGGFLTDTVGAAHAPLPPQPALYLHGADDGCVGAELAERVRGRFPHPASQVEVLPATGHFLHLEAPGPVIDRIVDFVATDRRAAPA